MNVFTPDVLLSSDNINEFKLILNQLNNMTAEEFQNKDIMEQFMIRLSIGYGQYIYKYDALEILRRLEQPLTKTTLGLFENDKFIAEADTLQRLSNICELDLKTLQYIKHYQNQKWYKNKDLNRYKIKDLQYKLVGDNYINTN